MPPVLPGSDPDDPTGSSPAAEAALAIRALHPLTPSLGIVLGSGFAGLEQHIGNLRSLSYREIPGFAAPAVHGHPGMLHLGHLGGAPVAVLAGRSHYYEGHDLATVTFPIRVLHALGIRQILLTNAAGGIREDLAPGSLVSITDHLNLMGAHPLRGTPPPGGFVDLSEG